MRVLLLTDIHGDVEKLEKILEKEEYDAILCAGDLSDANEFSDYESNLEQVLEKFDEQTGKIVQAVPGNMDPEEKCVRKLIDHRINLHKNIASAGNFEAVGFGGGKTPFGTPFEPEGSEIRDAVDMLYKRMTSDTKVAVIHQPPKDTKLDLVDGDHVGSEEVKQLIDEKDFDLFLTGHIHEARGRQKLEDTLAVNPGPVMDGYYAIADIGQEVQLEMKQL